MKINRIVFITNGLSGGGAERVMSILANWFANNNFEVTFLSLKYLPEAYKLDNRIKVIYKSIENKHGDFFGDIFYIRKFMKNNRDAIYVSFFTRQNLYTIIASAFLNIRIIVSERADPQKSVGSSLEDKLRSCLYKSKNCKKIVFQSHGAMACFDKKIQNKGCIILNPLISKLPVYQDCDSTDKIIACGRLTKQKNYPLLINSFKVFTQTHPNYTLHIFGEGELKDELIDLIEENNLSEKVFLEGFTNHIHEEINKGAMFVMSSDYEGLSNALLEAMAIGIPCITTDSAPGGAREVLVNRENGLMVPVNDLNALIDAMNYMADNRIEAVRMGDNAKKIRDEINENRICNNWLHLIEGI